MKKLAVIALGTALLAGCGNTYSRWDFNSKLDNEGKISVKFDTKAYKKEEVEEVLTGHLYSALRELGNGAKNNELKEGLRELHKEYESKAVLLINTYKK